MKLRIGLHGDRRTAKNTRGRPFCGLGAFVGTGPTMRAHVYTAANLDEITIDSHKKMDGRDWPSSSRSTCAWSTVAATG